MEEDEYSQIPREINVKALHDRQMVAQQLERDNVQNPLETIDRSRNDDGLVILLIEHESRSIRTFLQRLVAFAADDDRSAFPSRDL
jgi:hypothetical protein